MGSPFPGMDPYLEDPLSWPGLHHLLIGHIGAALNRVLPSTYVAKIGERRYVVQPDRSIVPDVTVRATGAPAVRVTSGGGTSVADAVADPAWEVVAQDEEHREAFVEILGPPPARDVVCVIEVLSPANKAAGGEGHRQYRSKQRAVMSSPSHLLEVDLLRSGAHTVAVPRESLQGRGAYDYLISLSRSSDRARFTVWARTIRERLPRFLVPLSEADGHASLDLQALFEASYDGGAFSRTVDYHRPPVPQLQPADADWARSIIPSAR